MVLAGTVAIHIFGGSAGREDTAVQIGGAVSGQFCSWFKLSEDDRRLVLAAVAFGLAGDLFGELMYLRRSQKPVG